MTNPTYIPLPAAQLCLNEGCEVISNASGDRCPACGFNGLVRMTKLVPAIEQKKGLTHVPSPN